MKTRNDLHTELILEFATNMTAKGFKVFVSSSPHFCYACIASLDESRVMYVQADLFRLLSFSSCVVPSREGGTGYSIADGQGTEFSKTDMLKLIEGYAPHWYNMHGKFETLASYLARSGHSNYELHVNDAI